MGAEGYVLTAPQEGMSHRWGAASCQGTCPSSHSWGLRGINGPRRGPRVRSQHSAARLQPRTVTAALTYPRRGCRFW